MDGSHQIKQCFVHLLVLSLRSNFETGRIVLWGVCYLSTYARRCGILGKTTYQVDKSLLASRMTNAKSALSLGKCFESVGLLLELDLVVWVVLEHDERTRRLRGHF